MMLNWAEMTTHARSVVALAEYYPEYAVDAESSHAMLQELASMEEIIATPRSSAMAGLDRPTDDQRYVGWLDQIDISSTTMRSPSPVGGQDAMPHVHVHVNGGRSYLVPVEL